VSNLDSSWWEDVCGIERGWEEKFLRINLASYIKFRGLLFIAKKYNLKFALHPA